MKYFSGDFCSDHKASIFCLIYRLAEVLGALGTVRSGRIKCVCVRGKMAW